MIGPPRTRVLSAERFRDLLAGAPAPDAAFAADLRALRDELPAPDDPWPS